MKIAILSDTNKRKAFSQILPQIQRALNDRYGNMYVAVIDMGNDCVSIREGSSTGPVVAEIKLDTVDSEESRYKFRKATIEDIRSGVPLYVKQGYTAQVKKRVPEVKEIINIVDKLF